MNLMFSHMIWPCEEKVYRIWYKVFELAVTPGELVIRKSYDSNELVWLLISITCKLSFKVWTTILPLLTEILYVYAAIRVAYSTYTS